MIVCATILYYAMHLIRYGKIGQALTNEQLISIVLMMTFFVNGLYELAPDIISVREGMMFMLILYMSYKYGVTGRSYYRCGSRSKRRSIRRRRIAYRDVLYSRYSDRYCKGSR